MRGGLWRELARMEQEMEDLASQVYRGWPVWPWPQEIGGWVPPVDVIDRENEVLLRADLPGVDQKDIEVTAEEGRLTIRGERKEEKEVKGESYYRAERWAGKFSRSVVLPPGVDAAKIKATFKNGVLEVQLPKTKEAKETKIEIKVE